MKKFLLSLICILIIITMTVGTSALAYAGVELPTIPVTKPSQTPGGTETPEQPGGNTGNNETPEQPGGSGDLEDKEDQKEPEKEPEKELTADSFTDVKATDWFYDEIDYCVKNDIFDGTGATTFDPKKVITRAEFVQVLANLSGEDVSDKNVESGFDDVPKGKWYTGAVTWAFKEGIVDGVGGGKFAPDKPILRQEMCAILYNYMGLKKITPVKIEDKAVFADDAEISGWAKEKVYACQMSNLVNGRGEGIFDPKTTAIRAEAATIFSEFHKNYIK